MGEPVNERFLTALDEAYQAIEVADREAFEQALADMYRAHIKDLTAVRVDGYVDGWFDYEKVERAQTAAASARDADQPREPLFGPDDSKPSRTH